MNNAQEILCIIGTHPGNDPPLPALLTAIQERGGEITLCRLTRHGNASIVSLSVEGHWGALSRIETALPSLESSLSFKLNANRAAREDSNREYRPYGAEVYAPVQPGLLASVTSFFIESGALIRDLSAQNFRSGISGGELINVSLVLDLPMTISPHTLRDSYMDLCDELHADGVLDPIKS